MGEGGVGREGRGGGGEEGGDEVKKGKEGWRRKRGGKPLKTT